jgi:hypothetical protein
MIAIPAKNRVTTFLAVELETEPSGDPRQVLRLDDG